MRQRLEPMRSGNMTEALAKGPEEAIAQSEAHINDFLFRGGADTEAEDVAVGQKFGVEGLIRMPGPMRKRRRRLGWSRLLNRDQLRLTTEGRYQNRLQYR